MRRTRTPEAIGFGPTDRPRLARALARATDLRHYRRTQAVLFVARGFSVPDAARLTGTQPDAVYRWVRRYLRRHDPDRLRDAARSGRPRTASRLTAARVARELRRDPLRLGYNTTGWTVELLAEHLGRKYDCPITPRTLRRRMRAAGLRWKRPRYVFADRDPHRAQKKGGSCAA